jgi:hypothetical protein
VIVEDEMRGWREPVDLWLQVSSLGGEVGWANRGQTEQHSGRR